MGDVLRRVLGVLLILTAIAIPLSREPDRSPESLVARWAPAPSDFIEVKGQVVHLRDEGPRDDPSPIVLLHGTSSSLHTWDGWAKNLRAQRRVISFDLPGFGLTGPWAGQDVKAYASDDYRADTYARFVLDVMDRLEVPRAVVGGNSLGGDVAWRVAALAPQRVERLVLVDATGPPFEPGSVPLGWYFVRAPVIGTLAEHILPRALVVQGLTSVWGNPERITGELVDRHFELALREGNRHALGLRLRQLEWGEGAERIATLRQPTLILWGRRDRLVPPSVGEYFQKSIPGSELVLFDGLGHVPHEEDPARTLPALRKFLGLQPVP